MCDRPVDTRHGTLCQEVRRPGAVAPVSPARRGRFR